MSNIDRLPWISVDARLSVIPEAYGAKGDGTTDDTEALQAALDATEEGGSLRLRDGATYLASNLTLPSRNRRGIRVYSSGTATIQAIDDGDSNYLLASRSYVVDNAFSSWPVHFENIVIDANDVKDYGLVLTCAYSRHSKCEFINALTAGVYLSEVTRNGVSAPSVVDNSFDGCQFRSNAGAGFLSGSAVTDFEILGGTAWNNTGLGLDIRNSGGMRISNFHSYANTAGAAEFRLFGFAAHVSGSIFDGDVEIATLGGTNPVGVFGPHNTIQDGALICTLGGAGNPSVVEIAHCHFEGDAYLLHNFNGNSRKILLSGGTSEQAAPVRWAYSAGEVWASRHWSKEVGGYLDGLLLPQPTAATIGPAPNRLSVLKTLTASATSTDIVLTLTVPTTQLAGSQLRVKLYAHNLQSSSTVVAVYQGEVVAGFARRQDNALNDSYANVINEYSSTSSGISAAAAWGVSGTTGVQTATLTITVTHVAPSAAGNTMLRADVEAVHRHTTAMTLA